MKNTAIISNRSPRYNEWLAVFGSAEVPIINIIFPNKEIVLGEIRDVYMLDLGKLTAEQMGRLKAHIASKFKIPMEEVERELPEIGVPILAEDVIVTTDQMYFLEGGLSMPDIIANGDWGKDDGIVCECGSKTYLVDDQGGGLKAYNCENPDCEFSEYGFQVQFENDDFDEEWEDNE